MSKKPVIVREAEPDSNEKRAVCLGLLEHLELKTGSNLQSLVEKRQCI